MQQVANDTSAAIATMRKEEQANFSMTVPAPEKQILDDLFKFRRSLHSMKKESRGMLTLADIDAKAGELSMIMKRLRQARNTETIYEFSTRNRVDDVLDSIWMSMFYVWSSIAGIHESLYPTYVALVSLARTAEALRAGGAWMEEDVEPLQERVRAIEETLTAGKFLNPNKDATIQEGDKVPNGQAVLTSMLNRVHRILAYLNTQLEVSGADLEDLVEELEGISTKLDGFKVAGSGVRNYTMADLAPLSQRLHAIDSGRGPNGRFPTAEEATSGQPKCAAILAKCFEKLSLLVSDLDPVHHDSPLYTIYRSLLDVHSQLTALFFNQQIRNNPTKLSESLEGIQKTLQTVESMRVNGIFMPDAAAATTTDKAAALPGQATMHKLLHDCHALVTKIVDPVAMPVGETLMSTYELLLMTRSKLRKLRAWATMGWNVKKEMEDAEKAVQSVESTKVKGLFVGAVGAETAKAAEVSRMGNSAAPLSVVDVDSDLGWLMPLSDNRGVPDGQATVSALVDECDSLVWEIRCILVANGSV